MNWKQHLSIGLVLEVIFIPVMIYFFGWFGLTPMLVVQMIIIAMISPLVSDLDHEMGKLHQWVMATGFLIAVAGIVYWLLETKLGMELGGEWLRIIILGVLIAGASFFNANWSNHRGFWHSIPMAIIYGTFVALITGINIQLGVLAVFGFWTHLALDGIPFKIK